jgi:hypothetical protein
MVSRRHLVLATALAIAGCGDQAKEKAAANSSAEGADPAGEALLTGAEGANLADEAAADEAADVEAYGGNAAAGEAGNGL